MDLGVRIPHTGRSASPTSIRTWCTFAERVGFGVLWGVDHIVMPERIDSEYVLGRRPAALADGAVANRLSPNFEVMSTLAYVAAITDRIKLGTAVSVLSIRNAVLNARQLATVDRYSSGRLLYGVGLGWLKEEADAMGMPWDRRGTRADEHIELLRAIWTTPGPLVEFHGRFWDIPPMDPEPRPVQQPIPILIGGHSDAAIDRAARLGDGWIAADVSPDRLAELLPVLHVAARRCGREPSSIAIYCGTGRRSTISSDEVRRYEELGVTSLQIGVETFDDLQHAADELQSFLET